MPWRVPPRDWLSGSTGLNQNPRGLAAERGGEARRSTYRVRREEDKGGSSVLGRIKQGNDVVLKDLKIIIRERGGSGWATWEGSFFLPTGAQLEPGEYRLELSDGRFGTINILTTSDPDGLILFQGTGELARR
jgi:hypothetical protein